ncbi:DNA replication licensing factor mcm5 [Ceratocystis lukuohia]|uniref:DNA replication licensing factor MCM5 n=1 Tax=Ceratocystis lukuohia TaxID=2019550 RepID=A0ABR4MHR9_9PEZI
MDSRSVYTTASFKHSDTHAAQDSNLELQKKFEQFISTFAIGTNFPYRQQLTENALSKRYFCEVNITDLINADPDLASRLTGLPEETIPVLLVHSDVDATSLRDLKSGIIGKLVRVSGIVIGASVLSSRATVLHIQCQSCQHNETITVNGGFAGVSLPRQCSRKRPPNDQSAKCPLDPYFVMHEKSEFIDQQVLKLQEVPDQVPVGEMPRHVVVVADRYLTNRVVPGSRCEIVGVFTIFQNKSSKRNQSTSGVVAIRTPYLRCVGIRTDIDKTIKGGLNFSDEEEQSFLEMSREPGIFDKLASCIAPSIYGNDVIKKAILCLLLGGSKKVLPDGMKLRGDINVLLLGDPGTAKSQLLKYVERAAPISIYTSGKGSSAAGLTASVQRDQTSREFYLEGGAMVLADGGVVCIDEFDKMRDDDRVAIHEAMEQQTISIAKAGITTVLNARTSVLAAANPIFGRYDDMKTPGENIDFQTTILSRFDMIFIVRDEHSRRKDITMAEHVMGIQMNSRGGRDAEPEAEVPVEKMRRYISYCKAFVTIRKEVHAAELQANTRSSIPITVRQLEAIVRITESIAKARLSPIATEEDVDFAMKLFTASTMAAVKQGSDQGSKELNAETSRLEAELKRRLPIGWTTNLETLKNEMVQGRQFSETAFERAIRLLQRRETIVLRSQGQQVYRNAA